MMGVYLLIIACEDVILRGHYNRHALQWMTSWCCQATGVLAMTSCEVSVFILTYMSVERYLTIAFPFKSQKVCFITVFRVVQYFTGVSSV